MSYNNENTMTTASTFILPAMMDSGFDREDLGDDFEGLQLSFKKFKIPGGGMTQFEEPGDDPENPEYVRNIEGIIVYNHASNAYWAAGSEYDDSAMPLCSSFDGKSGFGTPGGSCEVCPMNQYGTDMGGGKGKACKNMRTLYILRSGEAMPIQLSLPPTSLRPFTDFMNSVFVTRQRPTWTAIVQIGLKRQDNGTNQYSVATFRKVADLTQEQLIQMRQYASNFRAQAKEMQQQRALEAVNRAAGDESFDTATGFHSDGDGEHFVLTGTINGDTGALPM